jgi:hypothetical protein
MHRQHCIGVGSLARYIGEAMDRPPICHAFIMAEKSFDIPAILFYLASVDNKNKWEDHLYSYMYSSTVLTFKISLFWGYLLKYHTRFFPVFFSHLI